MTISLTPEFLSLTTDRWTDLEKLFGKNGACGGCWCMWWRLKRSEFMKQKGEGCKKALRQLVESREIPGILAYVDGKPVGWCSVGPRESYHVLERSRVLKRIDDKPVWSVVCFFVAKQYRGKGLMVKLLEAAIEYVKEQGGKILEGYPVEPMQGRMPDPFVYTGAASAFRKTGFVEVIRRSETRPIMRRLVGEQQ